MRKLIFYILSLLLFTTGCSAGYNAPPKPLCRVVTEITVLSKNNTESQLSRYSDPKAMTKLLNYIRHLDPWDPADTIDTTGLLGYTITVHLSDGTQRNYEQLGLTYFRAPDDIWRQIPAEDGIRLALLVEAIK